MISSGREVIKHKGCKRRFVDKDALEKGIGSLLESKGTGNRQKPMK